MELLRVNDGKLIDGLGQEVVLRGGKYWRMAYSGKLDVSGEWRRQGVGKP